MLHIFQYDNVTGKVVIDKGEFLLIKEFGDLMDNTRNICKEDKTGEQHLLAYKEFTYIYLALDWDSCYSNYSEQERHQCSLKDSGLTEDQFNDPIFRAACRKYRELQESDRSIRVLQAARNTVDKFTDYFNNINPQERNEDTGKPIYKVKDIMAEVSNLDKVYDELKILEGRVKKEMEEESQLRGGATQGYTPKGF